MLDKKSKNALVGTWEGGADDGSGLRTMVYNFGLILKEDGTGNDFSWNKTKEGYDETEWPIEWEYLGENKLRIKFADDDQEKSEWKTIEYEISDFVGAYDGLYLKLVEKGKEEFWAFPEPIYRTKTLRESGNFFTRFWKLLFKGRLD